MRTKNIQILFISIMFIFVYFLHINNSYSLGHEYPGVLLYMFSHANMMHLFVNLLSFIVIYKAVDEPYLFFKMWVVAVLSGIGSIALLPTMGCSGMIVAMFGLFIGQVINHRLRIIDKKQFAIYVLSFVFFLIICLFNRNINNINHLIALVIGFSYGYFKYYK